MARRVAEYDRPDADVYVYDCPCFLPGQLTIHSAAQRGDVPTMERLVKEGKATANDRDDQNVTPLHWAA